MSHRKEGMIMMAAAARATDRNASARSVVLIWQLCLRTHVADANAQHTGSGRFALHTQQHRGPQQDCRDVVAGHEGPAR